MDLNKELVQTSEKLGALSPGTRGEIIGFQFDLSLTDSEEIIWQKRFLNRLHEIGFLIGEKFEVLNESPFSKDPMSIRIKGAVYAIRRNEANLVHVKTESKKGLK